MKKIKLLNCILFLIFVSCDDSNDTQEESIDDLNCSNNYTFGIDIDINEVYAGYYMQYYYEQVDDFIFTSYENFLLDLTDDQRSKSEPFKYFIDQFDNVRHQKITSIFQEFIDSEKRHLFSRGPEDD